MAALVLYDLAITSRYFDENRSNDCRTGLRITGWRSKADFDVGANTCRRGNTTGFKATRTVDAIALLPSVPDEVFGSSLLHDSRGAAFPRRKTDEMHRR